MREAALMSCMCVRVSEAEGEEREIKTRKSRDICSSQQHEVTYVFSWKIFVNVC